VANDYQQKHYEIGLISVAFNWTHSDITALTVRERKHWAEVSERRMGLKDGKAAETKTTAGR
jgi:hypothetical protein